MQMIGQHHVRADIGAVRFTGASEFQKHFVDFASRENGLPSESAGGHEINWEWLKSAVEAPETIRTGLFVLGFGGHRPPLQGSGFQRLQQLRMDPIKSAVAEDRYHVLLFQKRHELLYNMSGVRFVKGRPA